MKVTKLRRPLPPRPKPEPEQKAFAVLVPRNPAGQGQWTKFPGGLYGFVHDPWGD